MNYDDDYLLDRDINWFVDDNEIFPLEDSLMGNDYSGLFDNNESEQAKKKKQTASCCRSVTPSSQSCTALVAPEFQVLPDVLSHNHDTMNSGPLTIKCCHLTFELF